METALRKLTTTGVKHGKFGRHIWDVSIIDVSGKDLLIVSSPLEKVKESQTCVPYLLRLALLPRQCPHATDDALHQSHILHHVPQYLWTVALDENRCDCRRRHHISLLHHHDRVYFRIHNTGTT